MTRPGIEPTTSRSRGGRLSHKATVAVGPIRAAATDPVAAPEGPGEGRVAQGTELLLHQRAAVVGEVGHRGEQHRQRHAPSVGPHLMQVTCRQPTGSTTALSRTFVKLKYKKIFKI